MKFNRKDVFTGFIVILFIVAGVYLYKYLKTPRPTSVTQTPVSYEFKKDFEDNFKLNIPDNVNSIELKDVVGGDSRGIATENEILVDANDPESGFYQAWVEKDGVLTSLGKLITAKGGWLIEYRIPNGVENSKVIVSLEMVNDDKVEKRILEGSF
jgi:hypothetical protein